MRVNLKLVAILLSVLLLEAALEELGFSEAIADNAYFDVCGYDGSANIDKSVL